MSWIEPDPVAHGGPVRVYGSRLPAPHLRREDGSWVLCHHYEYDDHGTCLRVRAGFHFDLASVPRFLWPIVAPFELSIVAPLLHDALYRKHCEITPERCYTRADADRVFAEAMRAEAVPSWRRGPAWLAVRLFAWAAWRG